MFRTGHRRKDHEGEDAQERWTLVVFMAGEREQLQSGTNTKRLDKDTLDITLNTHKRTDHDGIWYLLRLLQDTVAVNGASEGAEHAGKMATSSR